MTFNYVFFVQMPLLTVEHVLIKHIVMSVCKDIILIVLMISVCLVIKISLAVELVLIHLLASHAWLVTILMEVLVQRVDLLCQAVFYVPAKLNACNVIQISTWTMLIVLLVLRLTIAFIAMLVITAWNVRLGTLSIPMIIFAKSVLLDAWLVMLLTIVLIVPLGIIPFPVFVLNAVAIVLLVILLTGVLTVKVGML